MLVNHDKERFIEALVFFADTIESFNLLKAASLLYQLDFRHLAVTGRSVTSANYYADPTGPVPLELLQWLDFSPDKTLLSAINYNSETGEITARRSFDNSHFTPRHLALMTNLSTEFAVKEPEAFYNEIKQDGTPWSQTRLAHHGGIGLINELLVIDPRDHAVLDAFEEHKGLTGTMTP